MRRAAAVAAFALLVTAVPAAAADRYAPPYASGPSGGGAGSATELGEDGRVVVARVYPAPGPLSCPAGGAYAMHQVSHTAGAPVTTITATFTEAAVDPYVFAVLAARDAAGGWLGSTRQRGPIAGEGALTLELDPDAVPAAGEVVTIQFGLQMASACPHADAGTVRFTQVSVA